MEIEKIQTILQTEIIQNQDFTRHIQHLLIDSRHLAFPRQSLFFAIQGERHNGHSFLEELYHKGVRNFVVEHNQDLPSLPEANILAVENNIEALQKLAQVHRKTFTFPVLAITGSNGKTIIKEWLAQLLAPEYKVVKSPKSYNSQVGVPLSLWQMNESHNFGIFEAGISKASEMEKLEKMLSPTFGIFSNIGTAHEEGFEHRQHKIQEKLKLFRHSKVLFYCADHTELVQEIDKSKYAFAPFTWSKQGKKADLQVLWISKKQRHTEIKIAFHHEKYQLTLPFTDDASIENLMHCLALMLYLHLPIEVVRKQIAKLKPLSMRLELKQGIQNNYLIDDSYNNDFAGLKIALDFLDSNQQKSQKVVILSDLLEAGHNEEDLYQNIASLLDSKKIDMLIGIGYILPKYEGFFQQITHFFPDTEVFLASKVLENIQHSLVLIKGARIFAFEKIVQKLQQKTHRTVLEINLNALSHNLNFYRSLLKPSTKVMVMVKAFAYGNGIAEVANLLQFHRVDYLAVAYTDEGISLRENGIYLPIMVMNPTEENFEQLLEYDLEPEIYNVSLLNNLLEYLSETDKQINIHLKIDTGMHRLGFEEKDISVLCKALKPALESQKIKIQSVFSHLAGSDEAKHQQFSEKQIKIYQKISQEIEENLGVNFIKHILNSPGIVRFPQYQFGMVRLGIGLYGVETNDIHQTNLQNISELKTTISQIKTVREGETVGYGRKGQVQKDSKIATIAIGYADGFSRAFSNGLGKVLVNGQEAKVIGNVCMDMTMIDITNLEAKEGDEVLIFGKEQSIINLAQSIETIPYEILTNISERVKRVFYLE